MEIGHWAHPSQGEVYRQIARCCSMQLEDAYNYERARTLRLYLSRRRYKRYRTFGRWRAYRPFSNEDEVEELFASLGFEVIHPERLNFAQQVAMYKRAEVVAGYPGSELHNAVFMKPGALLLKVGSLRSRSVANPNQRLCDELGRVRAEFLHFEGEVVDWKNRLGQVDIDCLRSRVERLSG